MANDWSKLPRDLLISITKLLFSLEDFIAFRAVCKPWRSAATKEIFIMTSRQQQLLPWLMLYEINSDFAKFYSLSRQKTFTLPMPRQPCPSRGGSVFSSLGWIMTDSSYENKSINLFHPLSRTRIQLPNSIVKTLYQKFVLSASPSCVSDYVVVLVYFLQHFSCDGYYNMAFWKPGNSTWTRIITKQSDMFLEDVVHYKGRFYAVDHKCRVVVLNIETNNAVTDVSVVVENIPQDIKSMTTDHRHITCRISMSIVESAGSLFVVVQFLSLVRPEYESQSQLRVLEVNLGDGTLSRVKSLGDRAYFVGGNSSSFSVKASEFSGCEANSIYLADKYSPQWWNIFTTRDEDSGIFYFKRREIDGLHFFGAKDIDRFHPPLWVQPTLL